MTLESVLLEEVTKSLPSMVGDQLKKRLIQADKDAAEVVRLTTALERLDAAEQKLVKMATEISEVEIKRAAMAAVGQKQAAKENELALREAVLKAKEDAAASQISTVMTVLDKVFRERTLTHSLTGYVPMPPSAGQTYSTSGPVDLKGSMTG